MLNVTALLTYALAVYMQIDDTTIPAPRATLQHHDTLSEYPLCCCPTAQCRPRVSLPFAAFCCRNDSDALLSPCV